MSLRNKTLLETHSSEETPSQKLKQGRTVTKTDPTPVEKYSKNNYGSLNQELETMRVMNKIIPEDVPDIIDYEMEEGDVTEIEYEFIHGDTVNDIISGNANEKWDITYENYKELEEIVQRLHDNEIVHGDLNRNNIMYGENDWTLIDPAGIMKKDADYEEALNSDTNRLNRIKGYLCKSRHQPAF